MSYEFKTCDDCKYVAKSCEQEPCVDCAHNHTSGGYPDRFVPAGASAIEIDPINHPAHYEGSTSLECIDVMEIAFGAEAVENFCLCNAFKYLWRYKHKGGPEDVLKAEWYLNHYSDIAGEYSNTVSINGAYYKMRELIHVALGETK